MPKQSNVAEVARLREALSETPNFYLVEFSGLSVAEMNDLRGKVIEAGGRLEVVKNTLLRLALSELEIDGDIVGYLVGPTALLYCPDDPIGPAKAIVDFAKEHEGLRLKAAHIEGRSMGPEDAEALAKLPSKLEIQSTVVGAIEGPARELVGILNAAVSELVYVLDGIAQKQQEEGA
ncbi:MAG: 50S ribosomal protein L10 [Armatimonadetes bacterium]|nr:50S ribosomal protein L10 [Armatimonadota bacterium]